MGILTKILGNIPWPQLLQNKSLLQLNSKENFSPSTTSSKNSQITTLLQILQQEKMILPRVEFKQTSTGLMRGVVQEKYLWVKYHKRFKSKVQ